jgi:hypothetical protein
MGFLGKGPTCVGWGLTLAASGGTVGHVTMVVESLEEGSARLCRARSYFQRLIPQLLIAIVVSAI